ncbi:MAG: MBL fold metallo-hydrolase [Crocinitomicaceae bacterium]|nr:MBL fold metallo-hydrolase [Crocinitomicaceae bacterium]
MNIEQIYTKCLAQGAYYITSNKEAIIIDPLREISPYIDRAKKDGVKIKYILETHFHADFVSGHIDLAKKTGASIVFGPNASTNYKCHVAEDGELISFGKLSIKVLHTPGHTMESCCYLLKNEAGKDHAIFTGDTLFIGDVGRPDLAQKSAKISQEDLAGLLFDSLQKKIHPLEDHVIVYPAHGAGSACGKNLSKETTSTIGEQKRTNYALRDGLTKNEFINELTDGILPPPEYFGVNVTMNKNGYDSIFEVMHRSLKPLTIDAFKKYRSDGTIILDTRTAIDFAKIHIPGSISIGLEGQFAPWVGALFPNLNKPLILICPTDKEEETIRRLSRIGYDKVIGFLDGGLDTWVKNENITSSIDRISAEYLASLDLEKTTIIDVRKPGEYEGEHIKDVIPLPLDYINQNISEYPKDKRLHLHCAGGYRSIIAASILKANGFNDLCDVVGGYNAISKTNIPKTEFICPNS